MKNHLHLLFLLFSLTTLAQKKENRNIVISNSSETYVYDYSKSKNAVEVKQEFSNLYTCTNFREKGIFYMFFDDQSSLDDVDLMENGKWGYAGKDLKNYSVQDIFYSDAKLYELELNFPRSGWQNQVSLKKTVKDPRYFCTVYFSESYPIIKKEISVVVPRWMKADIREYNFKGYDITKQKRYDEKKDADIYTYTINNLPERNSESHQPGPSYFLPHLLILNQSAQVNGNSFTFFNTLKDQYDWYRKIVNLIKNDPVVIKTKATEITKDFTNDLDKIKSVLYWIHDNIRYVAFEDGIAGFKPDEAQNVLNKKYGDCKGMANLTKEMLKSLGYDARLAWIGTNHIAYDYSTPALCVDNHMICCVIYKGKKYYLDGTESYLALENYAERIQGRQVLIEDGNQYMLERIPATGPDQNLCQFREKLRINNNQLAGAMEYLYKGENKEQLLSSFHSSKKESYNTQLQTYISNNNKNYIISDVKTSDINQIDGPLMINFNMTYDGAVSSFGNEIYIDADYNKMFNQFLIDTSQRKYDYCFYYKYNYNTEVDLEIPSGYKLGTLPADLEIKNPDFYFSVTYKMVQGVVQYRKTLRLMNSTLKKSAFGEWNHAIAQLSSKYLDQIILVKN